MYVPFWSFAKKIVRWLWDDRILLCAISCFHYSDVIMSAMASQITSLAIVYSTVMQTKENFKAPRHWPLWQEFTGDRWIPAQKASNAENISIWWRHHVNTWIWWRQTSIAHFSMFIKSLLSQPGIVTSCERGALVLWRHHLRLLLLAILALTWYLPPNIQC